MSRRTCLCFGDSNTYGAVPTLSRQGGQRFPFDRRWPGLLARELGPGWSVIEEGHPGRTTVHDDPIEGVNKNGLKALSISLESHGPLDLVILMLGTNDLKQRFSVGAGDIADGIECLTRLVKCSEAGHEGRAPAILVIAPCPILEVGRFGEMFFGGMEKSKSLGALAREAAERVDAQFLDAGEIVASSAIDGIHLDSDAHRDLAGAISAKVQGMFTTR